jgi:hypothetical protein
MSYHREHHGILPSLDDRGAYGGVASNNLRVIFKTNRTVNIKGIDNHQCTNTDIDTVGGVIHTHKGPVIGTMHQYALLSKGSSIDSPCQFEWYKNDVNDKSILVPGGPSVLDHEFKQDQQWGQAPTINTLFDEVSNYKQRFILHHTSYFQHQDGTTTGDISDQCLYAIHVFSHHQTREHSLL